jgi:hypothetical protein
MGEGDLGERQRLLRLPRSKDDDGLSVRMALDVLRHLHRAPSAAMASANAATSTASSEVGRPSI